MASEMKLPGRNCEQGSAQKRENLHVVIIDVPPNAPPLLSFKEAILSRKLVGIRGKTHHKGNINHFAK